MDELPFERLPALIDELYLRWYAFARIVLRRVGQTWVKRTSLEEIKPTNDEKANKQDKEMEPPSNAVILQPTLVQTHSLLRRE